MAQSTVTPVSEHDALRRGAYARFVIPEVDVLLRVALSITAQPADAEDLVQDTLLRAWRSIDTFDGRHPRAWLLTILRNTEINRHRRRRPELLHDPDPDVGRAARQDGPTALSAEDEVVDRQFDGALHDAVAALPERMRSVLLLVDVDQLSYAEAARVLGVPEGTVMSRLHRARKRVRDRLGGAALRSRTIGGATRGEAP